MGLRTKRYMYGHDRQAHAWDEAFNPVNIKAKANWRVRLQILGGGMGPTFAVAKSGRTKAL